MIVYVTKYALTVGLFTLDAEIVERKYAKGQGYFLGDADWCYGKDRAEDKANAMVKKKIASLKKQIEKLEARQKKGPKWKKQ